MPLTQTITTDDIVDAYHDIHAIVLGKKSANITVCVHANQADCDAKKEALSYKEYVVSDDSSDPENLITDFTDYFLTVHVTDNLFKRAESYLKDKVADYSGAIDA